jgi:excisionase family DNA binding protein
MATFPPYTFVVGFLTVCLAQIWLTFAYVSRIEHMTDKLNSIFETAGRLCVSTWTIRRLVDRGELRCVRVGRRVLISEREIMRVIRDGTGGHKLRRVSR